jgi:DNA-directed RNA polymerase sigma subunit (sigma70/sigma32)
MVSFAQSPCVARALLEASYMATATRAITNRQLLSHETVRELLRRIQGSYDPVAARELLASQKMLIARLVRETKCDRPIDQLIAQGNLGVLEAVHVIHPDRSALFSELAARYARRRIQRYADAANAGRAPIARAAA